MVEEISSQGVIISMRRRGHQTLFSEQTFRNFSIHSKAPSKGHFSEQILAGSDKEQPITWQKARLENGGAVFRGSRLQLSSPLLIHGVSVFEDDSILVRHDVGIA